MKNRITDLFSRKKKNILSVYFTAGFPALIDTVSIATILEAAGADMIEIGIPFSDPVADGPTIQESNKIALDKGMNLHLLVDQVREIRKQVKLPIILMGYLNPVMQYGMDLFTEDVSAAGVDGLILPDMPLYEYEESYADLFRSRNLCNTFLVSPTTSEERIRKIDMVSNGFIYAVSASSTTGVKNDFTHVQLTYFQRLQNMGLKNPFLVGFGISDHNTFSKATACSAGAIVGSAFINLLKNSKDFKKDITEFVKNMKGNGKV